MRYTDVLRGFPVGALVNHLWQTTGVAVVVCAMAMMLRRNQAKLRFRLWLLASLKFLLPFSLLMAAGQHLRPAMVEPVQSRVVSGLVRQVVQPYQQAVVAQTYGGAEEPRWARMERLVLAIGLVLWAMGAGAVLLSWLRAWRRCSDMVRRATPRMTVSGVPVRSTAGLMEPGVFGIRRPVMLVPEELLTRASAQEMEAIFAHELCHVRRRDNLTAAIHTLVSAMFWFHPAVWMIQKRLLDERERACDENVIDSGTDAEVYARSIVNVCRLYLEAPASAMAGVSGGELKRRVVCIMSQGRAARLSFRLKVTMAGVAFLLVSLLFVAGVSRPRPVQAQAAQPLPSFEVISIRPAPEVRNMSMNVTQTSWEAKGAPLKLLIWAAFSLKNFQVLHAPGWVEAERYTIRARLPEAMAKLPEEQLGKQLGLMEQTMLVDRFHLRYHWTTQVFPVYSLVVDKGGPKLTKAAAGDKFSMMVGDNRYEGQATPMSEFADTLGLNMDCIVQDRTGLTDKYTFKLTYSPSADADPTAGGSQPSSAEAEARLMSALREQLGLKLVAEKRPVAMLVVDAIERPTAN